jgi:hypothetical protein
LCLLWKLVKQRCPSSFNPYPEIYDTDGETQPNPTDFDNAFADFFTENIYQQSDSDSFDHHFRNSDDTKYIRLKANYNARELIVISHVDIITVIPSL